MHRAHALNDVSALEVRRDVDVSATPHEAFGHDSNHRPGRVVQAELTPEDSGDITELPLPEPVPQHHHRFGAWMRVRRCWRTADERRNAHDVEGVERAVVPAKPL